MPLNVTSRAYVRLFQFSPLFSLFLANSSSKKSISIPPKPSVYSGLLVCSLPACRSSPCGSIEDVYASLTAWNCWQLSGRWEGGSMRDQIAIYDRQKGAGGPSKWRALYGVRPSYFWELANKILRYFLNYSRQPQSTPKQRKHRKFCFMEWVKQKKKINKFG